MVFGVGDDLSVRISASTADFTRGINRAQESLQDLRRTAGTTSASLSTLGTSAGSAAGGMSVLSTVTTASLVPSIATLSTALVPLVGTFAVLSGGALALAGAFGAIVGTGLIAFGQQRGEQAEQRLEQIDRQINHLEALQDTEQGLTRDQERQLETLKERRDEVEEQTGVLGGLESAFADLRDELVPIITEFGERFVPLIEDALNAVPALVQNIIDAIGGTEEFEEALRSFGNTAFDVIPQVVSFFFGLAQRALPIFEDFVDFLINNGAGAFSQLESATTELAPSLFNLLDAVVDLLPGLLSIGTEVSQLIIPVLTELARIANDVIGRVMSLDRSTRRLVLGIAAAAPIILKTVGAIAALANPVGALVAVAAGLGVAWKQNFGDIRSETETTVNGIRSVLNNRLQPLLNATRSFWQTWGDDIRLIINGIVDLLRVSLVGGLDVVLSTATALLQFLSGDFSAGLETLEGLFERIVNRVERLFEEWQVREIVTNIVTGIRESVNTAVGNLVGSLVIALARAEGAAQAAAADIFNALAVQFNALAQSADRAFAAVGNAVISQLNKVIVSIQNLIDDLPGLEENLPAGIGEIEQIARIQPGENVQPIDPVETSARQQSRRAAVDIAASLDLSVEGDGPLAEFVRQQADVEVRQRERRVSRIQNRGTTQ